MKNNIKTIFVCLILCTFFTSQATFADIAVSSGAVPLRGREGWRCQGRGRLAHEIDKGSGAARRLDALVRQVRIQSGELFRGSYSF